MKNFLKIVLLVISICSYAQGPANVSSNLNLWLKADTGVAVSGGSVTSWTDQSTNGYVFNTASGTPTLDLTGINNQSSIVFDGSSHLQLATTNLDIRTFFIVYQHTSVRPWEVPFTNNNGAGIFHGQIDDTTVYSDVWTPTATKNGSSFVNGSVVDLLAHPRPKTVEIHSRILTANDNTTSTYYVGRDRTFSTRSITGQISEIIAYSTELSETDRLKVETYLSRKYGVELENTSGGTSGDYVLSDGSLIWDASENIDFNNNRLHYGRDNNADYEDTVGVSSIDEPILTVDKGATFTSDLDYLLFGNNNLSTTYSSSNLPTGVISSLERLWKVETNGTPGSVTVSFELGTGIPDTGNASDYVLILDNDTNFSDATVIDATSITGGTLLNFDAVNFTDGQIFTVGLKSAIFTPGNVSSGITHWYKGASTSATIDGEVITQWNNSVSSLNASQSGTSNFPVLSENQHNFNPSVYFENGDNGYFNLDLDAINDSNYNIIAIVERDGSDTDNFLLGTEGSSSNNALDFGYNLDNSLELDQFSNSLTTSVNNFNTPINSIALVRGSLDSASGKLVSELRDGAYTESTDLVNSFLTGDHTGVLGKGSASDGFNGYVSEVIIYNQTLTNTDLRKIYSYLAIKYGITLSSTDGITSGNYRDSDDQIIWNNTVGYETNIIGIGRDDQSALSQIKSQEQNTTLGVVIEKEIAFTGDDQFVMIANNGASESVVPTSTINNYKNIVGRVWRTQTTGTPGTVNVSFTLGSGVPNTGLDFDYALLIDTDTDFSDATIQTENVSLVGNTLTFNNVNLNADGYFTLAYDRTISGPGDVDTTNLSLWLRADNNVVTSGSDVSQWQDSHNSFDFVTANDNPQLNDSGINFNPSIDFNGNDALTISGNLDVKTVFIVYNHTSVRSWETPFTNNNGAGVFHGHEDETQVYSSIWTPNNTKNGTSYVNGTTTDLLTHARPVRTEVHTKVLVTNETTNTSYTIGADRGIYNSRGITGQIAEIISYSSNLSDSDRNKINSYLASKYGITLDSSINYIASDGTTVIWDKTINADYYERVGVIGQDDASGLNQKQSKSGSENSVLTVGLGSIAATNALNSSSFDDDLDFLAWGSKSSGTVFGIECGLPILKVNRDWKVQNTGSVGTVSLSFDMTDILEPQDFDLLIDVDGDFTTTGDQTTITPVPASGTDLSFSGVTLPDGVVFTLIRKDGYEIVFDISEGGWSGGSGPGGVANIDDDAKRFIIKDDLTFTLVSGESFECTCLNVDAGVTFTLSEDKYASTTDLVLNGDIYLEGEAELIQNSVGVNENTGTGNIYKVLGEATDSPYRYNYFASPVQTSGSFSLTNNLKFNTGATLGDNTDPSFTRDLDGSANTLSTRWTHTMNNDFAFLEITEATTMNPGVGFTMKGTGTLNNYNFIGSPNNGDITVPLTSGNFLLTGNPYPSTIDGHAFNTLNSGVTEGIIYVWDQPIGDEHFPAVTDNSGGYATIGAGMTVAAATLEDEVTGVTDATTPSGYLKPGQGFVVYGDATGDVQFENSLRSGVAFDPSRHFFKTNKTKTIRPIIRLGFGYTNSEGKVYHRQLATALDGSSMAKEVGKDAFMFDYYNNDAYWIVPGEEDRFVITSVPAASDDLELPIGVVVDTDREITFTLDGVEDYTGSVYVYDKVENTVNNIKEDMYTAFVTSGETSDRFSLVFKGEDTLSNDAILTEGVKNVVSFTNNELEVTLEKGAIEKIEVYSLTGSTLLSYKETKETNHSVVKTNGLSNNFYIVKVVTNTESFTKKIYLE